MITIKVRAAQASVSNTTVIKPITATPNEVFDEIGLDVSTSVVSMAGARLTGKLNNTFEELGVEDGTAVTLAAIVKADGAAC